MFTGMIEGMKKIVKMIIFGPYVICLTGYNIDTDSVEMFHQCCGIVDIAKH